MDSFRSHTGRVLPLRRSAVDTDQIIPAVYLKRVTRTGFADGLFSAWRNDPDFVLNRPVHAGATVLVAGNDFGTGSSREHAVWALQDHGFRVVVAPRFADIFRGNAGKSGLLTAEVPQTEVQRLWDAVEADPHDRGHRRPGDSQYPVRRGGERAGRAVQHRRLHPLAAARGSRRHQPYPAPRSRGDLLRAVAPRLEADHDTGRVTSGRNQPGCVSMLDVGCGVGDLAAWGLTWRRRRRFWESMGRRALHRTPAACPVGFRTAKGARLVEQPGSYWDISDIGGVMHVLERRAVDEFPTARMAARPGLRMPGSDRVPLPVMTVVVASRPPVPSGTRVTFAALAGDLTRQSRRLPAPMSQARTARTSLP